MKILETFGPVALAVVPVLMLFWQLRDQNRLERKRIEAEILRRALESLNSPVDGVLRLLAEADDCVLRRFTGNLSQLEVVHEMRRLSNAWEEVVFRHRAAIFAAQAFALEQKRQPLVDALSENLDATHALGNVIVQAMQRVGASEPQLSRQGKDFSSVPEVERSVKSMLLASQALVKRFRELYG